MLEGRISNAIIASQDMFGGRKLKLTRKTRCARKTKKTKTRKAKTRKSKKRSKFRVIKP
jgi:hypothetical protein